MNQIISQKGLPWRYAKLREFIGYRHVLARKYLFSRVEKERLLSKYKEGKKVLFIHIPKTAGVSVIKAYDKYFADARHTPAWTYKVMLGSSFNNFSTFSIVRNPWARLFSAYHFLLQGGATEVDLKMGSILKSEYPDFNRFVKEWLPRHGTCCFGHFVPQYEFLCGFQKKIIVDQVVKLEELNDVFSDAVAALGMPYIEVPRLNVSGKVDYRDVYDEESQEIVARLYRNDIKLLDYQFNA